MRALILTASGVEDVEFFYPYYRLRDDLKAAGADYVDQEVVVDGNLITSRKLDDLPAFCREIFAVIRQAV